MFDDLNNQRLNKVPYADAKAYPSVNSPNDGGFNSEENMRWLTKALSTKPFIIGQNDDEVNKQFQSNGAAGNGVYTASGMFSVDGYIMKLAKTEDISFDNTDAETFMTNNTQSIQRFVHDLTNQGTSDAIDTDLTHLLFDEYNPSNQEIDISETWETAYNDHECIGYICNVYYDTYLDQLSSELTNNKVKFENTEINVISDIQSVSETVAEYVSDLIESQTINAGDSFATNSGVLKIYYPIYFNDIKIWNDKTESYDTRQQMQFKDIFGLTFFYDVETCDSKSYPTTHSVFVDFNNNYPLNSISFSGCKLNTAPTNLYNFEQLYDSESKRYVPASIASPSSMPNILDETGQDALFVKKTIADLIPLIPSDQSNIPRINNTLSYYCLNNVPEQELLTINGTTRIPVAFMTSEGSLCPDGFMYNDTTKQGTQTYNRYPVEGYVHFAKRYYLKKNGNANPSEDDINNLPVTTLCSWNNGAGNFTSFFNTYLAKPISVYIHYAYCSLLDNVVYGFDGNGYDGITDDYKNIKSTGCGKKLYTLKPQNTYQDDNAFYTYQTYKYDGYTNNAGTMQPTSNISTTVTYMCDITSDVCKLNNFVFGTPEKSVTTPSVKYYIKPSDAVVDENILTYIDDPINYYRRCSYNSNSHQTCGVVRNAEVYKITINSSEHFAKKIEKIVAGSNAGVVDYLLVDNFLVPIVNKANSHSSLAPSIKYQADLCATLNTHTMVSLATTGSYGSVINGLNLTWLQNCWKIDMPYTLNVSKDNLDYLRAYDITDPQYYKGVKFEYKFPQDVQKDDLFIYNLIISTNAIIGAYDLETSTREHDTTSKYSKRRREAFIHFNKIYGDDFCSIDDQIIRVVNEEIPDFSNTVQRMQEDIQTNSDNISSLTERVGDLELAQTSMSTDITNIKNTMLEKIASGLISIDYYHAHTTTPTYEKIEVGETKTFEVDLTQLPDYVEDLRQPICMANQFAGDNIPFNSDLSIVCYYDIGQLSMDRKIKILLTNNGSSDIEDGQVRYLIYR